MYRVVWKIWADDIDTSHLSPNLFEGGMYYSITYLHDWKGREKEVRTEAEAHNFSDLVICNESSGTDPGFFMKGAKT